MRTKELKCPNESIHNSFGALNLKLGELNRDAEKYKRQKSEHEASIKELKANLGFTERAIEAYDLKIQSLTIIPWYYSSMKQHIDSGVASRVEIKIYNNYTKEVRYIRRWELYIEDYKDDAVKFKSEIKKVSSQIDEYKALEKSFTEAAQALGTLISGLTPLLAELRAENGSEIYQKMARLVGEAEKTLNYPRPRHAPGRLWNSMVSHLGGDTSTKTVLLVQQFMSDVRKFTAESPSSSITHSAS